MDLVMVKQKKQLVMYHVLLFLCILQAMYMYTYICNWTGPQVPCQTHTHTCNKLNNPSIVVRVIHYPMQWRMLHSSTTMYTT